MSVQNMRHNVSDGARELPAPLNHGSIMKALCELDAGQRQFVLTCIDNFHVSILNSLVIHSM
jgi:hypothetical protein